MGISFHKEEEITDEILQEYVEGSLQEWLRSEVEKWIQKSQSVFMRFVEIKEMVFYGSIGNPMPESMRRKLLHSLPKPAFNSIKHLVIRIRLLKDKIVLSSSDQEEMDYLGVMAEYAYRSSEPGSIIIKRKIDGEEIALELIPGERPQEFLLGIEVTPGKGLDCELYEKDRLKESLRDVSNRQIFEQPVQSTNKTDLQFVRAGEVIFTVSVFLMRE